MKKFFLLLSIIFFTTIGYGQVNNKDSVLIKIENLKELLLKGSYLNPRDTAGNIGDTVSQFNDEMETQLSILLTNPKIIRYNLDSLLSNSIGIAHSKDKRLWIFSWDENTGGSFKSALNLVHYRTKTHQLKTDDIVQPDSTAPKTATTNSFCSGSAYFQKIYKLPAKGKDLYLCIGWGIGCNTCVYNIASVVELTADSINFNYAAFHLKNTNRNAEGMKYSPCFQVGARQRDDEKFEYDPQTQTLTYIYLTDDNTPIPENDPTKQKRIIRHMKFDGVKFTGIAYDFWFPNSQ